MKYPNKIGKIVICKQKFSRDRSSTCALLKVNIEVTLVSLKPKIIIDALFISDSYDHSPFELYYHSIHHMVRKNSKQNDATTLRY